MLLLLLRLLLDEVLLRFDWLFVAFARREDDGMRRSGMPILLQVVGVDVFFFFLLSFLVRASLWGWKKKEEGLALAGWMASCLLAGWPTGLGVNVGVRTGQYVYNTIQTRTRKRDVWVGGW